MLAMFEEKRTALVDICRRYRVTRLYLFGSAVSQRFSAERSDLDFVVEMEGRAPTGSYADRFLDLADALQSLFERRVDVIAAEAIRNPYFRREVESTRLLIYERPDQEAAA